MPGKKMPESHTRPAGFMVTTLPASLHLETMVEQTAANSLDSKNGHQEAGRGETLGFPVIRHEKALEVVTK